jgi:adenine-specific DNA methylase
LAIGGELEWEFHVPIPSDVGVIDEEFTIDRALPVGTEIQFHVHNHGPNTWELVSVMVTR